MAPAPQKATPCCLHQGATDSPPIVAAVPTAANVVPDWPVASTDRLDDPRAKKAAMAPLIRPVDSLPEPCTNPPTKAFVEWQKWNFRIGFTPREGLVIYSVAYVDGSRGRRPVAHRLSFVEMVVPYGDPNDPHYRKNAFDAGEDGLGKNAHSLKKGCDCLGYIKYFDAHFTNFTGGVETIENCVCLHEEDHGILWKHQDWRTGLAEVRRSRRLTVSFICTVANYEYGFFWHFYQDGRIEAEVKLTGILSLGALQPGEFRKYGIMIAPGLYAPVHQHFFVARMDMAVDCKPGETFNQVVEVDVKVEEPGENNVHNNAFYAEERLLKSELQAMRDCNPLTARHWIAWLDLVFSSDTCRYVFGITHVPRLEDWPVMPVERIGFMLMPHGFFNCSPAVDVPPNACELDVKDNDVKDNGVAKPVQNELLSKL
ncbi:LOW QUALITY PROTEIN: uncharacterized protein LOC110810124 [Carica papaya]|uniref:LOW QUALITY PROTEIN: uncharacterized protein LOC110810124 n=1 Tax=Carica papaya TaxID=3649 RepID=UPI000B8D0141|nr:LOW QUALITY PROTEIN: uncharacterized protein LOC110810124 [Carica papaya]